MDLQQEVTAANWIGVTKDDVTIEDKPTEVCSMCNESPVTKVVYVDLRAIGEKIAVDSYCDSCAGEVVVALKDGLPDEDGTDAVDAAYKRGVADGITEASRR